MSGVLANILAKKDFCFEFAIVNCSVSNIGPVIASTLIVLLELDNHVRGLESNSFEHLFNGRVSDFMSSMRGDDGGGVMVASVRGGGDGDGEVAVAAAVGEEAGCGDGFWRVEVRGLGDRVDREMGNLFGFGRKSPLEKFFDGGGVVAGGGAVAG
ncbi:hypothetical protein Tco_0083649 [Tanacetum coccineum]